jgi:hypothetical protein
MLYLAVVISQSGHSRGPQIMEIVRAERPFNITCDNGAGEWRAIAGAFGAQANECNSTVRSHSGQARAVLAGLDY